MSRPERLIDITPTRPEPPRENLSTCVALVHVPTDRICPACGTFLDDIEWAQPALFYFAGRGETTVTSLRRCPQCRWTSSPNTTSVNPRRPAFPDPEADQ